MRIRRRDGSRGWPEGSPPTPCPERWRKGRPRRELASNVAEGERGHAPVSLAQRILNHLPLDREGDQQLVQAPAKRIQAWEEEFPLRRGRLQVTVVRHVPNHENGMVNQDEILGLRATSGDVEELDRHAATVALLVRRHDAGPVREADDRRITARLGEDADAQFGGQIVQDLEFRPHAAMALGMRIATGGLPHRSLAHMPPDKLDGRLDVRGLRIGDHLAQRRRPGWDEL